MKKQLTFSQKLYIQIRVIEALFYRELKTRFGQKKLGYLWIFLDPVMQIAVFTAILSITMNSVMPGIDYLLFISIGVVSWNLFNDTLNQSLSAVSANMGLLQYSRVHPIDTVFSRALLEVVIFIFVFPVIFLFLNLIGHTPDYIDIGMFLKGFFSLLMLSLGFGMFFSVLSAIRPEIKWIVAVSMRPLYLMSGIMYSLSSLSAEYQQYLLWNPLVHAFGIIRKALLSNYNNQYVNETYLFSFCILIFFLGIAAFVSQEHRLRMDT